MPEGHAQSLPPGLAEEDGLPPVLGNGPDGLPGYAELHCISNFSFQRGASHPQELVQRAYNLGYEALALTDECSVAGVVRALSGLEAAPGPDQAAGRRRARPEAIAPVQAAVRQRIRAGGLSTRRHRAQPARLGGPVRIHHRRAHVRAQGRIQRQLGRQRLHAVARLRDPAGADPRSRQDAGRRCAVRTHRFEPRVVRRPPVAGGGTAAPHRRRPLAGHAAPGRRAQRRAAGGGRRRVHARALAQAPAGRGDGREHGQARGRMWPGAAGQCRAAPAPAQARGRHLSARVAGSNAGGDAPLQVRPGRNQVRLPARDGAARPHAHAGAAAAHVRGCGRALPERHHASR